MNLDDLAGKNIVIWGTGREAQAAFKLISDRHPSVKVTFVDERDDTDTLRELLGAPLITKDIKTALLGADVIVKSPGVSLYHPLIQNARDKNIHVTSLLNLWFSLPNLPKTICITGTKGKSTTSALLAHALQKMGQTVALAGNIGVALDASMAHNADYVVIEVSSYQITDFTGLCDVAALTSLYPDHIKWHGGLEQYYRDKCRLLEKARTAIIHPQTQSILDQLDINNHRYITVSEFNISTKNPYLERTHNRLNVDIVLTIMNALGFDAHEVIDHLIDFKGLPHRQQELGIIEGILYVDDSIATNPQPTRFALDHYAHDKVVTLILGGQDKGLDYSALINHIQTLPNIKIIAMGDIRHQLQKAFLRHNVTDITTEIIMAKNMQDAIDSAQKITPKGGVILLSPAAPSFDLYNNFMERGLDFAKKAGF